MPPVAVVAKLTFHNGRRDEAVAAMTPMMEHVETEAGTLVYNLVVDNNDDEVVWVYEEYTDEAAMTAHGTSEAMKTLFNALGGLIAAPPELNICSFVRGKGR